MPWLVYRIGRSHFNSSVGLVAAGLTAVYAYFFYYAAALMTETFYIMAILWVLDLAGQLGQAGRGEGERGRQGDKETRGEGEQGRQGDKETRRQGALRITQHATPFQYFNPLISTFLLGVALSVTILLRQVFLLFIPFQYAWLLWRSFRYRACPAEGAEWVRPMAQMVGILAGAAVILILAITPWTIRNYRAFDRFVLLNTNAGYAFFWGNHPIHGYNFTSILPADGPSYQELIPPDLKGLNEAELDQALLKRSLAEIQSDPIRYVILSISRLKDYFKFWPSSQSSSISNFSRLFSFGILLPFMIYGLIYGWRGYALSETFILYLFILVYTGIHLLSWALIRYRLPVDAILVIFAAVAIVDISARMVQRETI